MKKKTLLSIGLVVLTAASLTGCGKGSGVDASRIPNDLANFLSESTPDDGIDQTAALTVGDVIVSETTRTGEDGALIVPVTATVTDQSIYHGEFDMTYVKDGSDYALTNVAYVNPERWVIEPASEVTGDVVRRAIIERGAITYSGSRVDLTEGNVSEVDVEDLKEDEDGTIAVTAHFTVATKYMDYDTTADLSLALTINGYKISNAKITDFSTSLSPEYAFEVTDEELMDLVAGKALHVGSQGVALSDITQVNSRNDFFKGEDLSMTIIANVTIEKDQYEATADLYYTYKMDEAGEYWVLDDFHGTNFYASDLSRIQDYYMGYIGSEAATLDILEVEGNKLTAVLLGSNGSERELAGKIDAGTLDVEFSDAETGKVVLSGVFCADEEAFTGDYGRRSSWTLVTVDKYRELMTQQRPGINESEDPDEIIDPETNVRYAG